MAWTEQREADLKQMWIAGDSASVIAAALGGGLSRNAVIGKASRLGLTRAGASAPDGAQGASPVRLARRTVNVGKIKALSAPVVAPPSRPEPPPAEVIDFPAAPTAGVDLLHLGHGCKWPLAGDHDPILFCGQRRPAEQPYCVAHQKLAISGRPAPGGKDRAADKYVRSIQRLARMAG